jgi:hypothetical protein
LNDRRLLYFAKLLQRTRPNAALRGDDDENSDATMISKEIEGCDDSRLEPIAGAHVMVMKTARKINRTRARAMRLPQSAGRTGAGATAENLQ